MNKSDGKGTQPRYRVKRLRRHLQALPDPEQALRESEARLQAILDHSPSTIFMKDPEGRYLLVNRRFEQDVQRDRRDVIGKTPADLYPPHIAEQFAAIDREILATCKSRQAEYLVPEATGLRTYFQVLFPLTDASGTPYAVCGICTDITERKRVQEQIEHLALHDNLTDLPNRVAFLRRLNELAFSPAQGNFALLFLDLDGFKVVNDSLGHHAGDKLLVETAHRLQACVRTSDIVARLGGDEFTILLTDIRDGSMAQQVCDRILTDLRRPTKVSGHDVVVTASIGLVYGDQGRDADELLRYADIAMYQAKAQGKSRLVQFQPTMGTEMMQRMTLENDLRRAVDQGEFTLHYQPIVSVQNGRTLAAEALIRWQHPIDGPIAPATFIPVAEELGIIEQIGAWTIQEAVRQAKEWQARFPGLAVNVNLSAVQLHAEGLPQQIAQTLHRYDLDPRLLRLEITESAMMADLEQSTHTLRALKRQGILLSLDDFGTGYSSLNYLARLPVDGLKIDRTFVQRLGVDATDTELVRAIITVAKVLNLSIIGEGVETEQQAALLKMLGCTAAQGYLYARPAPAQEFERWLLERS